MKIAGLCPAFFNVAGLHRAEGVCSSDWRRFDDIAARKHFLVRTFVEFLFALELHVCKAKLVTRSADYRVLDRQAVLRSSRPLLEWHGHELIPDCNSFPICGPLSTIKSKA